MEVVLQVHCCVTKVWGPHRPDGRCQRSHCNRHNFPCPLSPPTPHPKWTAAPTTGSTTRQGSYLPGGTPSHPAGWAGRHPDVQGHFPCGVSLFPGRHTFPYRTASEQSPAGKAGGRAGGRGSLRGLLYKASPGNSPSFYFLSGLSLSPSGSTFPLLLPVWRDCRSPCLKEIPEDNNRRLPWAEINLGYQGGNHQSQCQHSFGAIRPAVRSP